MKMMMIFMLTFLMIAFIMMLMNFLLSEFFMEMKNPNSSFECGMENNLLTRTPFSLQFFLIGLIFIIFDLEVIIILNFLPFVLSWYFMMIFILFMLFIYIGLVYEWKFNKLIWNK